MMRLKTRKYASPNPELSPDKIIEKLVETNVIAPSAADHRWGYHKRILSDDGRVHQFVALYKSSDDWKKLKEKPQNEMTSVELICYALMVDDISLIDVALFDYACQHFMDADLSLSLACMSAAMHYMQQKSAHTLELLEKRLTARGCIVTPLPVYMNLAGADFENINMLNRGMPYANLTNVNFKNAVLDGTSFDYSNLSCANLDNAILKNIGMIGANFSHAKCQYLKVSNSSFLKCSFNHADLSDSKLNFQQLNECRFKHANLSNSQISTYERAHLLDFSCANLRRAQLDILLQDVNLQNAKLLTSSDLFWGLSNLNKAFIHAAYQMALLENRSSENVHVKNRFVRDDYLHVLADNIIQYMSDEKSSEKICEIFDYAISHVLFVAHEKKEEKTYSPQLFEQKSLPAASPLEKLKAAKLRLLQAIEEQHQMQLGANNL